MADNDSQFESDLNETLESDRSDSRGPQSLDAQLIGQKERRKIRARSESHRGIWHGIGMFGLVGWSIATPTVIGAAIGYWLDRNWPRPYSWTLMSLFAGVVTGCFIAWYWMKREGLDEENFEEDDNDSAETTESPK